MTAQALKKFTSRCALRFLKYGRLGAHSAYGGLTCISLRDNISGSGGLGLVPIPCAHLPADPSAASSRFSCSVCSRHKHTTSHLLRCQDSADSRSLRMLGQSAPQASPSTSSQLEAFAALAEVYRRKSCRVLAFRNVMAAAGHVASSTLAELILTPCDAP